MKRLMTLFFLAVVSIASAQTYTTGCGNQGDNEGSCESEEGAGDSGGGGSSGGGDTGDGDSGKGGGSGKGGDSGKGGGSSKGGGKVGANPVNVLRGSLQRHVTDIRVFGAAPFEFSRIYNSRTRDYQRRSWELGTDYTWQHNWQYEMIESNTSAFGFPGIAIRYPEGREKYFFATDTSGSVRVSDANWGDRLYPTGTANQYILRTPAGREYLFTKNASNGQYLLNEVRQGTGWKWTLTYQTQSDSKQRLYRITNNYGRYIQVARSQVSGTSYWRINSIATSDGRTVNYTYGTWAATSEHVLTSVSYPGTETATYTWVGSGSLTTGAPVLASAQDPLYPGAGSRTKYTYNYTATYGGTNIANGTVLEEKNYDTNLVIVKLPLGGGTYPKVEEGNGTEKTLKFSSTMKNGEVFAFNNLKEKRDGEGRKTLYEYQTAGGIADSGFRTKTTDDAGAATLFTPDFAGRVTSSTDAYGKTSSATYSANGFLLTRTDELNRTTTHTRNSSNQITRTDYPDGAYETFTYTGSGLLKTHRLKSGANETLTYDSPGNLVTHAIAYNNGAGTTVTDTTTHTYFANGLRSSTTDPRGNTTSFLYNWRGQNTRITFPGGSYKQFAYDAYGNMSSQTDELGHTWSRTYTEYNEVATSTDPLNRVTSYAYGQEPGCSSCGYRPTLTRITLPSGKRIEYSYDRSGKRISMTFGTGTAQNGGTYPARTTFTYDQVGNLVASTDGSGGMTTFGYDLLQRKTSETDPLLHTTSYLYNVSVTPSAFKLRLDWRIS